jgi:hypothetical protein
MLCFSIEVGIVGLDRDDVNAEVSVRNSPASNLLEYFELGRE